MLGNKVLYVIDYSDLGYYLKNHLIAANKEFLQVRNLIDPSEKEIMIMEHYDLLIFLSYHKSEKKIESFCVHHTGNWEEAWGGKEETLSIAIPYLTKNFYLYLKEFADIEVSLEVTHHGPTIDKPIVFLEIAENAYNEKRADLLLETAFKIREEKGIIAFGVGGNHYCSKFNKLEEKEYAMAHIIPKYKKIKEKTFVQAINKVIPRKTEIILIDKKGTNKEMREKIIGLAKKYNTAYEFV